MLVLTRACNLDCTYCYEGGWHHGSPMGVDTAMKALEMVASQKTPFHVQLTGGEPLLAADLLCAILDRIRKEGWPATTAVQTNGVLLNRDCARVFKAHGTAVGISVDGLPGIQEKLRGQSAATYRAMGDIRQGTGAIQHYDRAYLPQYFGTFPACYGIALISNGFCTRS